MSVEDYFDLEVTTAVLKIRGKMIAMKNKIAGLLFFCLLTMVGKSQVEEGIWRSIIKVEDNKYILNLPEGWKKVAVAEGSGVDYKFDFSGVGIPATAGGAPLYASFTISKIAGDKHKVAMDQVMNDFSVFYDRVTEPGYNYDTTTATIKSSQTGTMLHSRYYRRSKVSNYSKYYLVIYSPKSDETYTLTINFQYKDASYDIERSAHFNEYVMKVFGHFEFR